MDARTRLLISLLGCCTLDLDHLVDLWDRYNIDHETDDYAIFFGKGIDYRGYHFIMSMTLEEIALSFLRAHGLPKETQRDEVNNWLDSRIVFHDPKIQRLFEAWHPQRA